MTTWHFNEHPECTDVDFHFGYLTSKEYLGIYKDGSYTIFECLISIDEDGVIDDPIKYYSCCSEHWDITSEIVAWCGLPALPEGFNV
jgi:hypothetical protein